VNAPSRFSVTRKYKKFLAVGCSHGELSDPSALDAVLRFQERWRPDTTLHLGDAVDLPAFRSGAAGTSDQSRPVKPDFASGVQFIKDLRPQIYLMGNHEDRLWRLQHSPNAVVAEMASTLVREIEGECKQLKCRVVPYGYKQNVVLGSYLFCHGTIFTENCARDMAESIAGSGYSGVVFAHAHRAGMATARNWGCTTGYCTGHLMRPELAEYAKARKSTYAWSQGMVWGEYCDSNTVAWLHVQPQGQKEWRLPV
jgi:predicted phosphodiesterase